MNPRRSREKRSINEITKDDITFLLHAFNHSCCYCKKELTLLPGFDNSLELDHYRSLFLQDTDEYLILEGKTFSNIVPACRACNRSKSNKDGETWIKKNFSNADEIIYSIDFYFSTISFSFT